MRKILGLAVIGLVVLAGVGMPATALAGEVTGNGDSTPIGNWAVDASLCAFSGLEDGTNGPGNTGDIVEPNGPGATQTPHYEDGTFFPPGIAATGSPYNCVGQASTQLAE